MTNQETQLAQLCSLLIKLKRVLTGGKHNLDSKLRAKAFANLTNKPELRSLASKDPAFWSEVETVLNQFTQLGYFEEGSIVSGIKTAAKTDSTITVKPTAKPKPKSQKLVAHQKLQQRKSKLNKRRRSKKLKLIFSGFESSRRRH